MKKINTEEKDNNNLEDKLNKKIKKKNLFIYKTMIYNNKEKVQIINPYEAKIFLKFETFLINFIILIIIIYIILLLIIMA
jgi:hypothetical protein